MESGRRFRRLDAAEIERRVDAIVEQLGLGPVLERDAGTLSGGEVQRVALARALLHDPEVVLLDEPYTGLDPYASAVLHEQLAALKGGLRTVVLVTHNLKQGLELADRVAIQVRGRFSSVMDSGSLDLTGLEALYQAAVENPV